MEVVDSWEYLLHDEKSCLLIHFLDGSDVGEKFTPFKIFRYQVKVVLVLIELVYLEDVWVIKVFDEIHFLFKLILIRRLHEFFSVKFETPLRLGFKVEDQVDISKSCFGYFSDELVFVA